MTSDPPFPGLPVTCSGNRLVSYHTEARLADAGVFYPITPSTEMGELFQQSHAEGRLNVFGRPTLAIETEGEHAAQGGAIACAVTGKRVVNFTSGQGLVYALEQYFHAPGKLATMVVEVATRALTKHALNVHCGHDDVYTALGTGWIILMARDAQQAADQALILRSVTELSLTPGINCQDGFLTSHLERTFLAPEAELIRTMLGAPEDVIDCPTDAQRELFGSRRRRVPEVIDLRSPLLLGPVQNQEHYMPGVVARRIAFYEPILGFLEEAYDRFAALTGRRYGLLREYRTEGAEQVFVSLGSAAENVEAAVDHLAKTRGARVGSIHVNVLRPFPEAALVRALRGKRDVIVLERTDEPLSVDNPLTREVRAALARALERGRDDARGLPALAPEQTPRVHGGVYGLGSRDFRPEGIIGAFEYATGQRPRTDGVLAADTHDPFVLGVRHPYEVRADETPSLLPDGAIAVRLHSIGGRGMITTGKNLGAMIGAFAEELKSSRPASEGQPADVLHLSANPKYGSEKKGAPTAYFLVAAPEPIRVNCDLRHVDVVLCCDPKAFTHMDPLDGIADGGALVLESEETPEAVWTRIPRRLRQRIVDRGVRLYALDGIAIARKLAHHPALQLRMQGNAFLGAFFRVSSFLADHGIDEERFHAVARAQYEKQFGHLGAIVVESNMKIMAEGFDRVREVPTGDMDAPDRSDMMGEVLTPLRRRSDDASDAERPALYSRACFDREFRAGLGEGQPTSPLASVGAMAAATGAQASKRVARVQTPELRPDLCAQCMACSTSCPDGALVTTAQDVETVLTTAITHYVSDEHDRKRLEAAVADIERRVRERMRAGIDGKKPEPFAGLVREQLDDIEDVTEATREELHAILSILPFGYGQAKPIFSIPERKSPGTGGLFGVFVTDLCKGCAECVVECGKHGALFMVDDSEELHATVAARTAFLDLLPETGDRYMGLYDGSAPERSKPAALRNHLMARGNYEAMVCGDGACAGCGQKSALRTAVTLTEAYMRPVYRARAERLRARAELLEREGPERLSALAARSPEERALYRTAVAHLVLGLGGESEEETRARVEAASLDDQALVDALVAVMRQDAFNHLELRAIEGRAPNGMSVMAMAASTGCNTVYGSTPPNNPHTYPWMNSLFQDGPTVGWLFGESFIHDHARRSVIPERLADALLDRAEDVITPEEYHRLAHFSDAFMTDREVRELPKAWAVAGDGAMGDIGFQNLSKAVLQNRPNVKMLMLDTQVYSNTGGQNSDSSPMPGGVDMNSFGAATQGKLTEKKSVAEALTAGHGSPFVAQVSMADQAAFYKAVLDGLDYRGTAFFQAYSACQPEHGVGDDVSTVQARRALEARVMPQFVFRPERGETYAEALDLAGNPALDRDWKETRGHDQRSRWYTSAHFALSERRFRHHFEWIEEDEAERLVHLDDMLVCITQQDVVARRFLREEDRSFVPDFGVFMDVELPSGQVAQATLSRHMVVFCVERRKAWRMLQSKAGIVNKDYQAQRALLARVERGDLGPAELRRRGRELLVAERTGSR